MTLQHSQITATAKKKSYTGRRQYYPLIKMIFNLHLPKISISPGTFTELKKLYSQNKFQKKIKKQECERLAQERERLAQECIATIKANKEVIKKCDDMIEMSEIIVQECEDLSDTYEAREDKIRLITAYKTIRHCERLKSECEIATRENGRLIQECQRIADAYRPKRKTHHLKAKSTRIKRMQTK